MLQFCMKKVLELFDLTWCKTVIFRLVDEAEKEWNSRRDKKKLQSYSELERETSGSRTKSEGGSTWGETDELAEDKTVSTRHRWRRLSHQHRGCGLVEGRGHRKAGSRVHWYKRQKQKQKLKGWHKNIYMRTWEGDFSSVSPCWTAAVLQFKCPWFTSK